MLLTIKYELLCISDPVEKIQSVQKTITRLYMYILSIKVKESSRRER